ncbi:MAG: ExbD/TolR family protein [Bdellovibrionota bacterium]
MAIRPLGGGGEGDHDGGGIVAEINITPLTDVFLVLLIIFMVTSSVMSQMGVDVNLPAASTATSQAQPEGVIVTLLPTGGIKVNDRPVVAGDYVDFKKQLGAAFGKTKSRLVILEGDRKAFLGSAIQVMDEARKAGADRFAIATSPEAKGT